MPAIIAAGTVLAIRKPFASFVRCDAAPPGKSLDRTGILPDQKKLFDVVRKPHAPNP